MTGHDTAYLRTWDPELCSRALEACGSPGIRGNTIPGTLVLRRALGHDWSLGACHEVMCDLQGLADRLTARARLMMASRGPVCAAAYVRRRLVLGTIVHRSHGGTGDCLCLWCRVWRMWLGDLEDALSEW